MNDKSKRSLFISDDLWEKIKIQADKEHRSAAQLISVIMENYIESKADEKSHAKQAERTSDL